MTGTDPLEGLLGLPGTAQAAAAARDEVDALLWDRAARLRTAELAAQSRLRGGWASAALEGADVRPELVRSGAALDDSPMGLVLAASLRLQDEVPRQVDVAGRAALQAIAALHALVARGQVPDDELGRPRRSGDADDPLRLGPAPDAGDSARRLAGLADLLTRPPAAPALLLAAVAHAEIATARPFAWGNGLVARASVRLVLAGRGVDPDLVTVPEAGVLAAGRPAYVRALRDYATGSPEGVANWLVFHCDAVRGGVAEARRALAGA